MNCISSNLSDEQKKKERLEKRDLQEKSNLSISFFSSPLNQTCDKIREDFMSFFLALHYMYPSRCAKNICQTVDKSGMFS